MNDDTWVTCPYNKAHRALKSRFQIHLTKCRENHKGQGGQKQCPYDANHIVNAVEFEYHLGECESRLSVLHFQSQDQEVKLNVPPATRPLMIVPAQSEEDWETEAAGGSCYQPGENLADLPVFIQPTGLAPAERKNFRRNERSRHQYIENKGNTWKPTDSFINKKIVQPVHTERKAKLSTSSCESFNSSNPPETPDSYEAPAPITAWKPLDEAEISSGKSESLEVEASSSTGTVPPAQPVFSYANAARKAKEAAAADPKAVEQSITFVMRADPKADEPKTVATRADPVVVDERPKKVATSGSALSWRSVVAESNKKEVESPLNRSASSVESSSSAGTTTQAKSTFNYASAAKKVKEAADTKVDQQPRVIAAKVDEQPKVITTTNSSMSWRSVVVESNKKEMESSLNTSSSSAESCSSASVETQLKAIVNYANVAKQDRRVLIQPPPRPPPAQSNSTFNYANAAKKPKEADPVVDEQPKTSATTNSSSSSSLPWRSAAVAKKKEIENPSAASAPEPKSTTFNYASVAKKEKEADAAAAAVADEQPKTFARMASSSSSAWRTGVESDKKETESSTSRSTSPVKSVWSAVAASQTKSTTLNYANLANKLKAAEPKVVGASSTGTTITAASQTKSTLNYANLATKLKGAEPRVGKPTKTFDEMHRQLLKSFAKINFKSNVNKFQFSSTDSNNYY